MKKRSWRGSDELREAARLLRRKPTPAEQIIWEELRDHRCGGFGFRRQASIGQFVVDFYCAAARFVVELDGGVHLDPAVRKRDVERQAILERDYRMSVMRIANRDVLGNRKAVVERIFREVKKRAGSPLLRSGGGAGGGGLRL